MKQLLIPIALTLPLFAEEAVVNPNIGHRHHHHHHGDRLPTEPAGPSRFMTSREAAAALNLPKEEDAFSFVVFGDRTGGPDDGVGILADAVRDVNLLEPDLVMTVGDMIQGYNVEEKWKTEVDEFKGIMNELSCPWFPVAGNHDVYWRGPKDVEAPVGGHEKGYEVEFGPLWYAFEHKNCWFIVLYSDEANPETGEQNFNKPDSQKMSPDQFEWLGETLDRAKEAEHVFLFLHHPRWLGNNYGDDWDRVHKRLREAGNVSAVFAGHIHRMRYDGPRDGIEYVTLATTGGHQPGLVPDAGYLHHFDIVTVRKDRLALAAVPVGEVLDIREVTAELVTETNRLSAQPIRPKPPIDLERNEGISTEITVPISNPSTRMVDYTAGGLSKDSRWRFQPDHLHGSLAPGETMELKFAVSRPAESLDDWFAEASVAIEMEYLGEGFRYAIPKRVISLPVTLPSRKQPVADELAIDLNGKDEWLSIDSERIKLDEQLTLECRFKARRFDDRTGLVTKTEGSDYGIFINGGRPHFSVFVGNSYLTVSANSPILEANTWHHVAGVYDGEEARLYLDGKLVDRKARKGQRKTNDLPLVIGGDTSKSGAVSHFDGLIDEVRLSRSVRYTGEIVEPDVGGAAEDESVVLLGFSERIGPWVPDASVNRAHATVHGDAVLVPSE